MGNAVLIPAPLGDREIFVLKNAKRRMGVERSTGALAIVNHHSYRLLGLGTRLAANSEVLAGTLAAQSFPQ